MPRIRFANDDLTVQVAAGISLPQAANEAGAGLPFGCRAGTCGTCVVTVLSGEENLDELGFVESDTLAVLGAQGPGRRLGCQIVLGEGDIEIAWDE